MFVPIVPMLAAAFLGFVFAKISTGFKRTNIVQTVLVFAFVVVCFASRFFVEDLLGNNKVQQTLETVPRATNDAANVYLPARWFANAIAGPSVLDALLFIGTSALLFAVVLAIVGGSYKSINSALRSHAASKSYKMGAQRQRSVVGAIAYKEFKRFTGSTVYMTNGVIGVGLSALFGLVTLVVGFDKIVAMVTHDAPLYVVLGIALCAFSTAWGCVCGVKHMRLDWENEVEVIKQSAAVALYMLPNMFVVMGLTVLVVFLGLSIDHRLLTLAFCALVTVLAGLSYRRVIAL